MKPDSRDRLDITVIMPALNEEKNILSAVDGTLKALEDFDIKGEIIIVNDGSTDNTRDVAASIIKRDKCVRMISHRTSQGIGASFWDGVDNANGRTVIMIPGDNENNPWEILRYYRLLDHVDIIIPFIFNKGVRSLFRNTLSFIYRFIINSTFFVNLNYTNGTVLYRKSILKELNHRSNGFFFQTDILIRTIKEGYLFAEVPYKIGLRKEGISRAVLFPSLLKVVKGYFQLVRDIHIKKDTKIRIRFPEDSLTSIRRNGDG